MQRDNDKVVRSARGCDKWKELRCRNCTHWRIFGLGAALNKPKGGTCCPQRVAKQTAAWPPIFAPSAIGLASSSEKPIHLFRTHPYNFAKLRLGQGHNRQTGLSYQRNFLQPRIIFNFTKRNRSGQRFDRRKIDGGPIGFVRRRIWICLLCHFCDSDYGSFLAAVIEKDFIALAHSAQIISRSVIAHARPASAAFRDKV